MVTHSLSVLAGIVCLTTAQNNPAPRTLPLLPEQYEVWVSANIVNRNYSVLVHEIYDSPKDRILISQFHPGTNPRDTDLGYAADLYLNEYNELIHLNDSGCFGFQIDQVPRSRNVMGITPGHIPSTKDFLRFAMDGIPEVYQGQERVNGVLCDHWRSDMSNATTNSTMYLDWYFTASTWNMAINTTLTSLPHMLHLTGSRPDFNPATFQPTGLMHTYEHMYEFRGWHIGDYHHHHGRDPFTVPSDKLCVGNLTFIPRAASTAPAAEESDFALSTGSFVGILIGSIIAGAVVGAVLMGFLKSSKQSQQSSNPTFNNPVATQPAATHAPSSVNNGYYDDDATDSTL